MIFDVHTVNTPVSKEEAKVNASSDTEIQLDDVHPALVLALRSCGRRAEAHEEPERRFEYCMSSLAEIDGTRGRWKPGREPITEHVMALGVLLREAVARDEVTALEALDALVWGVCDAAHQTEVLNRSPSYRFESDLFNEAVDDAYRERLAEAMQDE